MCHLLQMKAERLLTQAQAQISTLKLAGHLVEAAVCSNALQDAETDGTAENAGVVFAVQLEASLLPSSNTSSGFIVDKMGFPFCPPSCPFCSQLFWNFPPFIVGHSYCFFPGFDFFLLELSSFTCTCIFFTHDHDTCFTWRQQTQNYGPYGVLTFVREASVHISI